jgi:hypothetical protein
MPEEWAVVLCSLWFVGGLYLDGWAHNHLSSSLETFFTPWHAVFYSGFVALAAVLLALVVRRKVPGKPWNEAVPHGYRWALAGIGVFFLGGMGDMVWHIVFGIEANIDALLSPTHLLLAIGLILMVSAPLRAWYLHPGDAKDATLARQLPMILSLACVLSLLTFMTQYNHFVEMRAGGIGPSDAVSADRIQALAISGFLFQTFLLMGSVFLIMKRSRIVPGALTILFTLNVLAMVFMRDGLMLLPSAILAGIVADALLPSSAPTRENDRNFRLFAFVVPFALFLCYFLTIIFTGGTWWSIHLWTGSVFIAGIAGLLLSYLALPPRETL